MSQFPRLVPAIIPQSLDHLEATLRTIQPFCRAVQIDIVDGKFVPFTSWPYIPRGAVADLKKLIHDFTVEIDLMIEAPERVIEEYLRIGITSIVVHIESVRDKQFLYEMKRMHPFRLGLSINNDTPLAVLSEELAHADYVQLMGIAQIGVQGQPFDARVLTRIREVRALNPGLIVSIDGSVHGESIVRLHAAGADRFVSGSAILGANDPQVAYTDMLSLISV